MELPLQIFLDSSMACLVILAALGSARAGAIVPPQVTLDALLKFYLELGLPLPPQNARLLRCDARIFFVMSQEEQKADYVLIFASNESNKRPKVCSFRRGRGTDALENILRGKENAQEVLPTTTAAKGTYLLDGSLVFALQSHARGWSGLAEALLAKSKQEGGKSPKEKLIKSAWDYWTGQLTEPETDRRAILLRLRSLVTRRRNSS